MHAREKLYPLCQAFVESSAGTQLKVPCGAQSTPMKVVHPIDPLFEHTRVFISFRTVVQSFQGSGGLLYFRSGLPVSSEKLLVGTFR